MFDTNQELECAENPLLLLQHLVAIWTESRIQNCKDDKYKKPQNMYIPMYNIICNDRMAWKSRRHELSRSQIPAYHITYYMCVYETAL